MRQKHMIIATICIIVLAFGGIFAGSIGTVSANAAERADNGIVAVDTAFELMELAPADLDSAAKYELDLESETASGSNDKVDTIEDVFGIEKQTSTEDVISAIEDTGLYQVNADADQVTVFSPYARHRIIVFTDSEIIDTFGAESSVYYTVDGGYRLCYPDDESTKYAYDAFVEQFGSQAVMLDMPISMSADAANSWGTNYMKLNSAAEELNADPGEAVKIAILDTGIDADHIIFNERIISSDSKSFIDNSILDENGHGTAVAGLITESTPDNAELMILKIADKNGEGSLSDMVTALQYASDHGADVVNISLNACYGDYYNLSSETELRQIQASISRMEAVFSEAKENGVVTCVSAGNDNRDIGEVYNYPAMSENVLSVGATDSEGMKAGFSSYGNALDFAAPGVGIDCASIVADNAWKSFSGTSAASPHIAAAAAIIKSYNPNAGMDKVEEELASISEDLGDSGKDVLYGYGVPIFGNGDADTSVRENDDAQLLEGQMLPADWDTDDPENFKKYEQIYGSDGNREVSEAGLKVSDTSEKTEWKIYQSSDSKVFYHDSRNTENANVIPMIDVSYHNQTIDFNKVKAAGIQGVFIRCGYTGYSSGTRNNDVKFLTYIKDAKKAGLKVGVYYFSQAITEAEAKKEAEFTVARIKEAGYSIDLPVAFDVEYAGSNKGRLYNANLSKTEQTNIAKAFCAQIISSGYTPMVYANSSFLVKNIDGISLKNTGNLIWMARWNNAAYSAGDFYAEPVRCWQCTSKAAVDGISTAVDLDYYYQTIGKFEKDAKGNLIYYEYNAPATKVTNVIKDPQSGYWYNVVNGVVTAGPTVSKNANGWWYINGSGYVDFAYNGFARNANGWWYCKNGKVNFSITDVIKGTVDGTVAWWNVKSNKVTVGPTVSKNSNGWWYINSSGYVDFTYNGFAQNGNGWWYCKKGKVDFSVTDVIKGTINGENAWWNVKKNKVTAGPTISKNSNGWWYIDRNGKVDFNFTGIASNQNGSWYLKNGKVQFGYSGKVIYQKKQYTIRNGKVL